MNAETSIRRDLIRDMSLCQMQLNTVLQDLYHSVTKGLAGRYGRLRSSHRAEDPLVGRLQRESQEE